MTRRLTALALALVLALSLTGCWEAEPEPDDFWNDDPSSPTEETPRREPAQISDFTLPYLSGQTFDPVTCIDGVQQTVGALLYEPLFTLDTSFTPQPVLCERSSCDAQALTWTFALRSAVFSDGTALTANDVLAARCSSPWSSATRWTAYTSNTPPRRSTQWAICFSPSSSLWRSRG